MMNLSSSQGTATYLLNSRMAVSLQDAVQGVCAADGEGLGGGQEGVPSPGGLCANAHEAGEAKDAAISLQHLKSQWEFRSRHWGSSFTVGHA